jgi:hypothetical protein
MPHRRRLACGNPPEMFEVVPGPVKVKPLRKLRGSHLKEVLVEGPFATAPNLNLQTA